MIDEKQVYMGKYVTRSDSQLTPVSFSKLFAKIKEPSTDFITAIERLRTLQTINQAAYREEKKNLPFFTCGSFSPPLRHSGNFGSVESLVLDIDHLSEKELTPDQVKNQLKQDIRVVMAFVSPGYDGVKVLLQLESPCYDAALYSVFYRRLALGFSREHGLEQVIDKRTCDVTRVCFMSYDPEIYFNPGAQSIRISDYADVNNELTLLEQEREVSHHLEQKVPDKVKMSTGPDKETLALIRQKLNPAARPALKPPVYVPEELNSVASLIEKRIGEFDLNLSSVTNIQYGKKMKFEKDFWWAELNIFYGKRGFSVVPTPKRGSNVELAELAREVVVQILTESSSFVKSEYSSL